MTFRTSVRAPTLVIFVALLLSGCVGSTPEASEAKSMESRAAPDDATVLAFRGCSELNFVIPVPSAFFDAPSPMRPRPLDPAGQIIGGVGTVMRCGALAFNGTEYADATAVFGLIPVEPVKGAEVPNATSYLWLTAMGTDLEPLRVAFQPRDVKSFPAKIGLTMGDVGGQPKNRATFTMSSEGLGNYHAESLMLGSPFMGKAGTLGLYTHSFEGTEPPGVHAVHFSDYRGYERGTAVSDRGILPILGAGPTTATHNFDYDVEFQLDLAVSG